MLPDSTLFGVWKDVEAVSTCVPGGSDKGVERMLTERKYSTQVFPRNKLGSVLNVSCINIERKIMQIASTFAMNTKSDR